MARCERKVEIDAPVEVVWAVTQTPNRRKEWDYRVEGMELADAASPGKGVKFRTFGKMLGKFGLHMEFIAFEPCCRSAVRLLKAEGMPLSTGGGTWRYTRLKRGRSMFHTTLQMTLKVFPGSRLVDRYLLEPALRWMTEKSLRQLKAVAEADARLIRERMEA